MGLPEGILEQGVAGSSSPPPDWCDPHSWPAPPAGTPGPSSGTYKNQTVKGDVWLSWQHSEFEIRLPSKIINGKQRSQHTLARQKIYKNQTEVKERCFVHCCGFGMI
jgi:hypothetical protein